MILVMVVTGFALIAAVTDLIWGRIFNLFIVVMMVSGLAVAFANGGLTFALQSLAGMGAGLLLYGWMFAIGVMGAGDVKFLMALGAWGGAGYALEVAVLSVLVGGAVALVLLFYRGRLRSFANRVQVSLMTLVVKELEFQAPDLDRKATMPFGVPMSIAAVWAVHSSPLMSWLGFTGGLR